MTVNQAKHGLAVVGKRGSGVLFRSANGWDVVMDDNTVCQTIDLAEWEPRDQVVGKSRTTVPTGKKFGDRSPRQG